MDGLAVSLLPAVIGGYRYLHRCNREKFRARTLANYRLVFDSAFWGIGFFLVARVVVAIATRTPVSALQWLHETWHELFEALPYLGTSILALALSEATVWCLNKWKYSEDKVRELYKQHGGHLFRFLYDAVESDHKDVRPVMLTLRNRKVYVGVVRVAPTPEPDGRFLRLLPIGSGARGDQDMTVHWTTEYKKAYDLIRSPPSGAEPSFSYKDFDIVIPLSEIVTATNYVQEVSPLDLKMTTGNPGPEAPVPPESPAAPAAKPEPSQA